jgi:hypothetical protein
MAAIAGRGHHVVGIASRRSPEIATHAPLAGVAIYRAAASCLLMLPSLSFPPLEFREVGGSATLANTLMSLLPRRLRFLNGARRRREEEM